MGTKEDQGGKFNPVARLMLEMLRAGEIDGQPEPLVTGCGWMLAWMMMQSPAVAADQLEAGFLDVAMPIVQRYNPMERIGLRVQLPHVIMHALGDCMLSLSPGPLADMATKMMAAEMLDIIISSLTAYMMLNSPADSNVDLLVCAVVQLETLLGSAEGETVKSKLRSAGTDAFRYLLDNPLVFLTGFGHTIYGTGSSATGAAATVWGRDEDGGGGLVFSQSDIATIVQMADPRGDLYVVVGGSLTLTQAPRSSRAIFNLCVSDANKQMLLSSDGFIRVLVDCLLLDPELPMALCLGFGDIKTSVQREYVEALEQIAVSPLGRAVLLSDPTVVQALEQVADQGWSEEARECARGALSALSDREVSADVDEDRLHLMVSYQWDVSSQAIILGSIKTCGWRDN